MLVFEQGHLQRRNLSRTIFADVNYFSSALVKENLSYFPFALPRRHVKEKLFKENLLVCTVGKFSLTRWLDSLCSVNDEALMKQREQLA